MSQIQKIRPCLWFDKNVEEAANFYVSVFKNSEIVEMIHNTDAGPGNQGDVLAVVFRLDGQEFMGLNGGPEFTFSEAISFQIDCHDQEEVDYYWDRLAEGGEEGPCGWLKDRFGLSWQIVPSRFTELIQDPDRDAANRVMQAMFKMKKLDIAALEEAAKAIPV